MKVIDLQAYKNGESQVKDDPITTDDLKVMSGGELLDQLQEAIDMLVTCELYSSDWNHIRNWIDDIVGFLDDRVN